MNCPALFRPLFAVLVAFLFCTEGFGQSSVIISQYIETNSGSSPKGIEIYNVSGVDIDFSISPVTIDQGTNGAPCSGSPILTISSGILLADEVWVVGTSNLTAYTNSNGTNLSGTETFSFSFNGDDALILSLGGQLQDMFGVCGSDPGSSWSGSGVSTANHNLQIKDGICNGDTDGWTDPSERFDEIDNGSTMTGFGDAPAVCGAAVTSIQFESSATTVSENGTSISLCVDILNQNADTATTAEVAIFGSDSPHLTSYFTTTITFPAGSSSQQCVTIPITDDLVCANGGQYTLVLQNIAGPFGANIGSPDEYELNVSDDDGSLGTIVKQGFEEDISETFNYTTTGNGDIAADNSGTPNNQRIRSGSQSFQSSNTTSVLTFSSQDISSFTSVELEIWNSSISGTSGNGADNSEFLNVYVSESTFDATPNISLEGNSNMRYGMNGTGMLSVSAPSNIAYQPSSGSLQTGDDAKSKLLISIPDSWNTLNVRIELNNNNTDEIWCLDDIRLRGITCDACVDPTISSFSPESGPKETVVSITGTNFITGGGLTDVLFGGVPASFTVISDTELTATVPVDATSGALSVLRGSCAAQSANLFTFLEEDCDNGTASLILTELCDPDNNFGTDRYIEFYNPSDVAIDLTGWTVYALVNETDINDQTGTSWSLSGTIEPDSAMTCGFTNPVSGGPHDFQNADWDNSVPFAGASNWAGSRDDGAALYNGSTLVDAVLILPGSNTSLYNNEVLLRNSDICTPNPDAPESEWTHPSVTTAGLGNSTPGEHSTSCVLLTGANPSIITATTPNIAEPICNNTSITVSANSGSAISYQWYFNDGSSSWTPIVDNTIFSNAQSSTLSISSIIGMEDYQFYCELTTDVSCINYTRAIQIDVLENDKIYFKSTGSGLWSNPATWEFSDDLSNYSGSCIYPTKANAELIEIDDGDLVTYDLPNTDTIPSLWVLDGGILETQSSSSIVLDEVTSGAEFIIEGTYIDNGTTFYGINFLNGATWELEQTGTIVKTNTSSVAAYRDNYEEGIDSIPVEANWIYRRIANNDISVASIGMVYPNLSFENDFDMTNYSPTLSTHIFSGNSSSVLIKGDLNIGISGSGSYTLRTNNANSAPILLHGDLYIGSGSGFSNQSSTADFGTGIEIHGEIYAEGLLRMNYGSGAGVGILSLSGSEDIYGYSDSTFYSNHFIINKDPGINVEAEMSFDVEETAQFLNGVLEIDTTFHHFNFGLNATASNASNASFIDGKVRKIADASTNFTFPIGDSNANGDFYQPARIFDLSPAGSSTFEAQYFAEENPFAGAYYDGESNNPNDNQEIGNCDYWTINKISGTGNVKLALKYTNDNPLYCNVINDSTLMRIASLNPSNNWDLTDSNIPALSNEVVMDVTISTPSTGGTFGDFSFYSDGGSNLNVLPIELLSFDVEAQSKSVLTKWSTSTETNNDFFTVERSDDAMNFRPIATIDGAGTSHSAKHYSLVDEHPLPGISYYRLKQTDFDDMFSYSDVKSVSFEGTDGFDLTLLYRDETSLNLVYNSIHSYIVVEIFDVLGKRVYADIAENYGGRSVLDINLRRGAYVVRISSGDKWDSMKMVW